MQEKLWNMKNEPVEQGNKRNQVNELSKVNKGNKADKAKKESTVNELNKENKVPVPVAVRLPPRSSVLSEIHQLRKKVIFFSNYGFF